MLVNVIGCGSTGNNWDGSGFSIGVNDAFKFGHRLNWLVVVNHFNKFKNEPLRVKTMMDTKPDKFITHSQSWLNIYPKAEIVRLVKWHARVNKGTVYCSETSPFVAISLAYNLGATDIVLWGVDFDNHPIYSKGKGKTAGEIDQYLGFIKRLDCMVWAGCEGVLHNKLPIWSSQ